MKSKTFIKILLLIPVIAFGVSCTTTVTDQSYSTKRTVVRKGNTIITTTVETRYVNH